MTNSILPNDNERLDRIERIIESLARGQENLLNAAATQGKRIDILVEGQLGLQSQMGLISEQTLQLKRAVDYLLSRDGGGG